MSKLPIRSFFTKRSELNKASKGVIYLSKIGIGLAVAGGSWLVSKIFALPFASTVAICITAFVTEKICYYVNKKSHSIEWDDVLDWICDGVLSFGWLVMWNFTHAHWIIASIMIAAFVATYPYSCE